MNNPEVFRLAIGSDGLEQSTQVTPDTIDQHEWKPDDLVGAGEFGPFEHLDTSISYRNRIALNFERICGLSEDARDRRGFLYGLVALAIGIVTWGIQTVTVINGVVQMRDVMASEDFLALSPELQEQARTSSYRAVELAGINLAFASIVLGFGLYYALVRYTASRALIAIVGASSAAWSLNAASIAHFSNGSWSYVLVALVGFFVTAMLLEAPSEATRAMRLWEHLRLPAPDRRTQNRLLLATLGALWFAMLMPMISIVVSRLHLGPQGLLTIAAIYGVTCFIGGLIIVREQAIRQPRTGQVVTAMLLALGLAQFGHLFAQNLVDAGLHTITIIWPSFFSTARDITRAVAHETQRGQNESHYNWVAYVIVIAASPVFEELIFRGTLQRIARRRFGPRVALLVSAFSFGIAHAIAFPTSFFQHVGLGLGFATAFELAGGDAYAVIAPIAGHLAWNLAATLVIH